jgi:hypothetical protein
MAQGRAIVEADARKQERAALTLQQTLTATVGDQ